MTFKLGLAKTAETFFYTEYTDFMGTLVVLRTGKVRIGAGKTTTAVKGTCTLAQANLRADLLGISGCVLTITDVGLFGTDHISDGTVWRPMVPIICTGTPLGAVIAPVGSLAVRTDGGAATTLYLKESGAGASTGWVANAT